MTDTITYSHVQSYRESFYQAKAALDRIDEMEYSKEAAHTQHHVTAEQWVRRFLALDSVENMHQDIWHSRQIADFEGLKEAYEDGLETHGFGEFEPLPIDVLDEIGEAIDEITVDAVGLPPQPPVEPEPWTPAPTSEVEALVEKHTKDIPHDLDSL